jgi:hypothetical protein
VISRLVHHDFAQIKDRADGPHQLVAEEHAVSRIGQIVPAAANVHVARRIPDHGPQGGFIREI